MRACVKEGKDSLKNMGEGGCSPGRGSAHLEESINRKTRDRLWWEEMERWYESGASRAKFSTAFKQRKLHGHLIASGKYQQKHLGWTLSSINLLGSH